MKKDTSKKYIAKYYHSDGNGIHLERGKEYKCKYNNSICKIKILFEYRHFYLASYNNKYKININKYQDNLIIFNEI